jgi:predicted TIM-barrel fold metal-dependent hydrolase
MRRIDTHAHVFHRGLVMAPGARYRPDYDAPLSTWFSHLDRHEGAFGVLVQPSFLGTDNTHMLDALDHAHGRLRGIAVVAPDVPEEDLAALKARGVVGVRFNLVGTTLDALDAADLREHLQRVARLGWQVEVHVEGPRLAETLPRLADFDGPIVIDHLGRPTPELGMACPGFAVLLAMAADPRIVVKLSAPYRLGVIDLRTATARLLDTFGTGRLVWGSDWPWTQHEARRDYAALLPHAFGIDPATETAIHDTARRLFGFG